MKIQVIITPENAREQAATELIRTSVDKAECVAGTDAFLFKGEDRAANVLHALYKILDVLGG